MSERDETFNRAMKFVDNMQRIKPGISNVYVFTVTDVNGDIVDEKYGMNLMTDSGFTTLFTNSGTSFVASDSAKLYVGTSTDSIDKSSKVINAPAFNGLGATNSNVSYDYAYPMYYSRNEDTPTSSIITVISRFLICYYDYNIDGVTEPVLLSEYGIGKSSTDLWTHSRIYDEMGSTTSITKNPDERLTITVYMCLSFLEGLITNGYANNRFTLITTNAMMYNRMFEEAVYTYKRNNVVSQRSVPSSGGHTVSVLDNNEQQNSTIMSEFTMYAGGSADSGYIDGFIQKRSGYLTLEPQFMDEDEDITLTNYTSETPYSESGFADKFGKVANTNTWTKETYPPITQLTIDTSKPNKYNVTMYNFKTGEWDNTLDFYNPDSKWYTETSLATNCGQPIYYYNDGKMNTAYVYQNLRTDDPITKIVVNAETVYVANRYWDYSDWEWVNDYGNLSEKAKTARYFIVGASGVSITPTRESSTFKLLEKGTSSSGYVSYPEFTQTYGCYPYCDSYEYGWWLRGNVIYIPSSTNRRMMTIGSSSTANDYMTYGRWLIAINSENNSVYTADMTGVSVSTVPTINTTSIPFSSNVNMLTGTYRTHTETGYICMQSISTSEAAVFDLTGASLAVTVHQWAKSCCIWGTNKIAYIEPSGTEIKIFNMQTNADEGVAIPLPDGVTTVPLMFAHTNWIWITNGSSWGYVITVSDGTITGYGNTIPYTSDFHLVRMTAVDDVLILYKTNGYSDTSNAYYISLTSDTGIVTPTSLSAYQTSNSNRGTRIDYKLRYLQDTTLMLLITRGYHSFSSNNAGSENIVTDFGQYLNTGTVATTNITSDNCANYILYGENIIYKIQNKCPCPNFMPIQIKGQTGTIGTYNYIKHISGKQWIVSFSNTALWGDGSGYGHTNGIPPGVPLASTDETGLITGWS